MAMQRRSMVGMEWGYALVAMVCVLVACVEMCDAVAVVDVYRLIQYDLHGIPLGSRRASLNHHASSLLLFSHSNSSSSSDLSRSVLIVPIARASISVLKDLLQSKRVVGGLLLLLPSKFSNEGSADDGAESEDVDADIFDEISDLEQWLINNNLPSCSHPIVVCTLKHLTTESHVQLVKLGRCNRDMQCAYEKPNLLFSLSYIQMHILQS